MKKNIFSIFLLLFLVFSIFSCQNNVPKLKVNVFGYNKENNKYEPLLEKEYRSGTILNDVVKNVSDPNTFDTGDRLYEFAGWTDSKPAEGSCLTTATVDPLTPRAETITAEKNYYAVYSTTDLFEVKFLSYNNNDGIYTVDTNNTVKVKAGEALSNYFTKLPSANNSSFVSGDAGYAFQGWSAETPGSSAIKTDGNLITNSEIVNSPKTYYAVYESRNYWKVTFKYFDESSNTYKDAGNPLNYVDSDNLNVLNIPVPKNIEGDNPYKFVGWVESSSGSQSSPITSGSAINTATTAVNGNKTYYALYKQVENHTVTFKGYDGTSYSVISTVPQVLDGTSFKNISNPEVSKFVKGNIEYSFVGWAVDNNPTDFFEDYKSVKVNDDISIDSDKSFVAIYKGDYLAFTAIENTEVSFDFISAGNDTLRKEVSLDYRVDGDTEFKPYTWTIGEEVVDKTNKAAVGKKIPLTQGQTIYFKGTNEILCKTNGGVTVYCYMNFKSTGKVEASGNVLSLMLDRTTTPTDNYAFFRLFHNNEKLLTAPHLSATTLAGYGAYNSMFASCKALSYVPSDALPATTFAGDDYCNMFNGCTALVDAPDLPGTDLNTRTYINMFYNCSSLIKTPEIKIDSVKANSCQGMFYGCSSLRESRVTLSASTLDTNCYYAMFQGCSKLSNAPELPATNLANYCYANMFNGCSSLTTAPSLDATTLPDYCYNAMFINCTSLINVQDTLPATSAGRDCCNQMFSGCTSLVKAPEIKLETLGIYCLQNMFQNCSSLKDIPQQVLPAVNLSERCYAGMFQGCTSLETVSENLFPTSATHTGKESCYVMFNGCSKLRNAPKLPMSVLKDGCYNAMFQNCSSLTTPPVLPATALTASCYYAMFNGCSSLRTAPSLPVTTLAGSCYAYMFQNCKSLSEAPVLPATTLTGSCYYAMFNGCTSLREAPVLPATTLAGSCYRYMFQNCTSLTRAPELPVTNLQDYCYGFMFNGCTSLTTAPVLPATTLKANCYRQMFGFCSSLTTAPVLPATTLQTGCYAYMFYLCTSLTEAPELLAPALVSDCYTGMFYGCYSLNKIKCMAATGIGDGRASLRWFLTDTAYDGTFICKTGVKWPLGENGIPERWQRERVEE